MAKRSAVVASTSVKCLVKAFDTATGAAKTGLAFNTSGISCYYKRNTGTASVSVTLATITTLGTFATGGFKEVDATNMPGLYEFHPPNAAFNSGAESVVFQFLLAGVEISPIEFELTAVDNQDATRLGMSALPAGPLLFKKNQGITGYTFVMRDASGQPVDSLTITAKRSIDGAAYASCTNSASFVSDGTYKINLSNGDMNGTVVMLFFTGAGALNYYERLVAQP